MVNNKRTTLVAIMALSAAHGSSAFGVKTPTHNTISRRPLFSTVEDSTGRIANAYQQVAEVTASVEKAAAEAQAAAEASEEASKLIMDIPPTPVAPEFLLPSSTQSWIQPKPFQRRFKRPKSSFLVSSKFSKAEEDVAPMPTPLSVRPLDMLRTSSKIFKVEQMTNFFKSSPRTQIHAASFAFFFASVGLLSVEPVARVFLDVLSMLPCASWEALKFDPLGASDWVAHLILLAISLELPYGFYSLMRKSDSIQKKRIYNGFFAVYAVAYLQSFFTLLSHAFIAHNTPLEEMLDILFKACLRTFIFGTGVSVQWGAWALVPTFVGVTMGVVGYGNWFGRVLALFSMYKYFIPEIPPLFRYSFFGLVFSPALISPGAHYTDLIHTLVALTIAMLSGAMAFSLNRKVTYGGE